MRRSLLLIPAFGTALLGCARHDPATRLGRVTVDTLADGAPRVISDGPVGWVDTTGWKLAEVTRISGGAEGPGELQVPNDAAVDGDGRVYVAERVRPAIKVYGPDGRFLRTIGREGEGPGEFERAFVAVTGDHLYVHDPRSSRTSLFDTSGVYRRSWPSFCCVSTAIDVDRAGYVEVPGSPPSGAVRNDRNPWQRTVRWYRPDTTVADTALVPAGPEVRHWTVAAAGGKVFSIPIPFQPEMVFAFLPDHRIIVGVGDRYQLAVTGKDGTDTTALFSRSWAGTAIPRSEREAAVDRLVEEYAPYADATRLRNAFRVEDVPATAPAFDWIGVDAGGDLWLRTPDPGETTRTRFDVFDPRLRWLGQVPAPADLAHGEIKLQGDRFLAIGADDHGGPVVRIYEIKRTSPAPK